MAVKRQGRSAWTSRRLSVTPQGRTTRRGVAVHWPGFSFELGTHAACLRMLDQLERTAIGGEFSALPYNQAACVHGYLIEGRGADRRSGANGSTDTNLYYGSVLAIIPTGTKTLGTPLLEALRAALPAQAPGGRLLGHRDVRPSPTECPGAALESWIKNGARLPVAPGRPGSGRVHVVRKGDTLWDLAAHYYGDGAKWERIAQANRVKDAGDLQPGQRLTIP